jgi:penicillin-binding protein 2
MKDEIRDTGAELTRFRRRLLVIGGVVLFGFGLIGARLVHLQVVRYDELADREPHGHRADRAQPRPDPGPQRHRAGHQLLGLHAGDHAVAADQPLDRTIDELAQVIDIQARDKRRFKKLLEESKSFDSLPIRTKLTDEEVARFAAQRYRFPGVEIKARLFRSYPWGELASHVIGYIGRINQAEKKQIEDWPTTTRPTTAAPSTSASSAWSRASSSSCTASPASSRSRPRPAAARCASWPAPRHAGQHGQAVLDIKLQKLVEDLYGDRRGAMVAIDPKTGEILAFVSKPTFDPNLFVDGIDSRELAGAERVDRQAAAEPRAARHLPAGLHLQALHGAGGAGDRQAHAQQAISDPGYFWFGNHKFRDDKEGGHGVVDMYRPSCSRATPTTTCWPTTWAWT